MRRPSRVLVLPCFSARLRFHSARDYATIIAIKSSGTEDPRRLTEPEIARFCQSRSRQTTLRMLYVLAAIVLPNARIAAKLPGRQRTEIGIPPAMTGNREPRRTPFT
jgi:hypothetical protein